MFKSVEVEHEWFGMPCSVGIGRLFPVPSQSQESKDAVGFLQGLLGVEKKMETTIMGLYRVKGLGWERRNGKEHGNYCFE